ncbi:hypothetical protein M8C21_025921 [Ambrosia artemisiifolia]|uniref:SPARK domain-containing protein n=1 Tax=Ambrosia artemisiifolia TaxID=4212 RepID=A0AAD5D8K3_AMBAR|nr:hypothetical protein M8C21_025921 [Ambrosia artemisiifolia]
MGKYLFLFLTCFIIFSSLSHASNSSSCPIDFGYINTFTFPWDPTDCRGGKDGKNCCWVHRSLFSIGLSQYLQKHKTFFLPNLQTSTSCISDFQSQLSSTQDVRQNFSSCLTSTDEFVANPSSCARIMTVSDWVEQGGSTPELESSCKGDLSRSIDCRSCLDAGMAVNSRLVSLNQDSTKCFQFTALFAAGIVNSFGPEDIRTADCILAQPWYHFPSESESKSKSRSNQNQDQPGRCGCDFYIQKM